jgi:LytS/YehU family sensor histidine kinase
LWFFLSTSALESLFSSDIQYIAFLHQSSVVRILVGVLIYFLLISLDFLILSFEEMNAQADHEASLSAMLRDAELNMLRSQIKPHFLFNSLNSISALTISNPQAAHSMIIKLSEFMRHSLQLGSEAMNTLNDELYHLKLYLDIEKVRFADRLDVKFEYNEDCNSFIMPAMILQPLLENAVKHGVNTLTETCQISIQIQCTELNLQICVSNNFDPDAHSRLGTGTGLANVRKRLSAIYGRSDLLITTDANSMFTAKLLLPIQVQNKSKSNE